jgi:hypothetical protein
MIEPLVYTVIEATLGNVNFLQQFVVAQLPNVQLTFTQYGPSTGVNLILLPSEGEGSGTFRMAMIAIVLTVGFMMIVLLLIILYRQQRNRLKSASEIQISGGSTTAKKRRRHDPFSFEPLEDDNYSTNVSEVDPSPTIPSGWMIVTADHDVSTTHPPPPPAAATTRMITTTWSDLTSDSESIMSSLHLDRIDEEVGECSYEEEVNLSDDHDNHHGTGSNDDENVEVSLSNSHWDDEIGSWPSSIRPLSLSRHHWMAHVSGADDEFGKIMSRHGSIEPGPDLNIEVSIDSSSTAIFDSKDIEIGEEIMHYGDTSHSFTFSSDSDSDLPSSRAAIIEPAFHNNAPLRQSEHFYDDDDFQSIEMCVVWMGNKGEPEPDDATFSEDKATVATFLSPPNTEAVLGCQFINDSNDDLSGYEKAAEESLTTVSTESHGISQQLPSTIDEKMTLPKSDITDSNELLKSTLGTESTWTDAYSFPSSAAYRSDLEVNSASLANAEEEVSSDNRAVIAHWAREVMIRLMSSSPKMLACGTEMESSNSNDTESLY